VKLFVDTWGWLILADPRSPQFQATAQCYRERAATGGRILTSDYVLDEVITGIFSHRAFSLAAEYVEGILASCEKGTIILHRVTEDRFAEAMRLRRRLADKPGISFTDLTSMVIMEELSTTDILTADSDFRSVGLGFRTLPD
jgi:predicted nucleic acid-binding protein